MTPIYLVPSNTSLNKLFMRNILAAINNKCDWVIQITRKATKKKHLLYKKSEAGCLFLNITQ